jgi:hypothetical protein
VYENHVAVAGAVEQRAQSRPVDGSAGGHRTDGRRRTLAATREPGPACGTLS